MFVGKRAAGRGNRLRRRGRVLGLRVQRAGVVGGRGRLAMWAGYAMVAGVMGEV